MDAQKFHEDLPMIPPNRRQQTHCDMTGGRSVTVQEAVILEVGCWLGAFKKGHILMMRHLQ